MVTMTMRDYLQKRAIPFFIALYFWMGAASLLRYCEFVSAADNVAASAVTSVRNQAAPEGVWNNFETRDFVVFYAPDVSLKRIDRQLRKRAFFFGQVSGDTIEEKIASRLDQLSDRAKQILDMRPRMPKITIRIFSDREGVEKEYEKLFHVKRDMKSFYVHKYSIIYTSEEDLSDSVVIHEMGHAVIDNYFSSVPPPKVAEILASFVDVHLDDE